MPRDDARTDEFATFLFMTLLFFTPGFTPGEESREEGATHRRESEAGHSRVVGDGQARCGYRFGYDLVLAGVLGGCFFSSLLLMIPFELVEGHFEGHLEVGITLRWRRLHVL